MCSLTHTVWAAPFTLRGLVQLRLKADKVVSSGASVTQDDLPTLLTHLAVVLMIGLIAVPFLFPRDLRRAGDNTERQETEIIHIRLKLLFTLRDNAD